MKRLCIMMSIMMVIPGFYFGRCIRSFSVNAQVQYRDYLSYVNYLKEEAGVDLSRGDDKEFVRKMTALSFMQRSLLLQKNEFSRIKKCEYKSTERDIFLKLYMSQDGVEGKNKIFLLMDLIDAIGE